MNTYNENNTLNYLSRSHQLKTDIQDKYKLRFVCKGTNVRRVFFLLIVKCFEKKKNFLLNDFLGRNSRPRVFFFLFLPHHSFVDF